MVWTKETLDTRKSLEHFNKGIASKGQQLASSTCCMNELKTIQFSRYLILKLFIQG